MSLPKLRKAPDFDETGEWLVDIGGTTRGMYFDRSLSNAWIDKDWRPKNAYDIYGGHLGNSRNKAEALEALVKKYGDGTLGAMRWCVKKNGRPSRSRACRRQR